MNATGRIVVPGLIDVHTHYTREAQGPRTCLEDGVTAWVDAGSAGADAIAEQVAVARAAPQQGRVLVNIGRQGILPGGDTMDLDLARFDRRDAAAGDRHVADAVDPQRRIDDPPARDDQVVGRRARAHRNGGDRRPPAAPETNWRRVISRSVLPCL